MTGTRRLLATVTARGGRTHLLADQSASYADLATRRHDRATVCGRVVDGKAAEVEAEHFSKIFKDCKQCILLAQGRGWID